MPADVMVEIDPRSLGARLRAAREARGLTQERAAEQVGLGRTTLLAIEKGERRVQPDELVALASLYGRKLSELLRTGEPTAGLVVQLRSTLPPERPVDSELLPVIAELERLCDDYLELERMCGSSLARRYPPPYPLGLGDPEVHGEDIAAQERVRLGLGDGPISNLREVLEEDVGLRLFHLDMPSKVAGMYAFTEEHGGCIAVNRKHPAGRQRLSTAHELGHFLTDRYRSEVTLVADQRRRPAGERFAEAFGRAFLMPAAGLRRRFLELKRSKGDAGVTAGDLLRLAHFFEVSFEALVKRVEELQLVPSGTWHRLRQKGFKVEEARRLLGLDDPGSDRQIVPPRFLHLALTAWRRGSLSEGQFASLLRTDRLEARRIAQEYGPPLDEPLTPSPELDWDARIPEVRGR